MVCDISVLGFAYSDFWFLISDPDSDPASGSAWWFLIDCVGPRWYCTLPCSGLVWSGLLYCATFTYGTICEVRDWIGLKRIRRRKLVEAIVWMVFCRMEQ